MVLLQALGYTAFTIAFGALTTFAIMKGVHSTAIK